MYTGRLRKPSGGGMIVNGTFAMMPRVGHAFRIDNSGPLGGEMTSNVTEVLESNATMCRFKTIDSEYILEFAVDIKK